MSGVEVRDAVPADAESIGSIHVRCWRHAYADLVPRAILDGLDERQRIDQWQRRLDAGSPDRSATLVSVDNTGLVTGFIHVGPCQDGVPDPEVGELQAVYLDPASIGTGAGRALIAAGMERLRAAGFERAQLDVLPGNLRARRVYEAAGWIVSGGPFVVEHGEHELPHLRYVRDL
jgi:ribosomal protein S18 acetylase RimI-like enzyme